MEEKIEIEDFIEEAFEVLEWKVDKPETKVIVNYICPECGTSYGEDVKFCSKDGAEIERIEITRKGRYEDAIILNTIHELTEMRPKDFSFEFIDTIEKRGDGDGYHTHYIFKRKSDDKHFYYYVYDGRVEKYKLEETKEVITKSWDFEKYFD